LVEDNPKPAVKSLVVNIEPSVNPYEENVNRAYKAYF
jgi:16S rRNA A1518/A1519 N6-dimethyltransferase RsmA/KsgA/DIM1 with predicted DNA glycosylase/AP lyase activity